MWFVFDVLYAILYSRVSCFVVRGCNVVSNECNEATTCLVQPIGTHDGESMYFGCVCFGVSLVS